MDATFRGWWREENLGEIGAMLACIKRYSSEGRSVVDSIHPVDTILPPRQLLALGLQHLLVMAASPITAAFVISRAETGSASRTGADPDKSR